MKTILALILLISTNAFGDEWRDEDTYREVAFQALNIVDWGQTRYTAKHPERFKENGAGAGGSAWLIGEHPSTTDVDRLMVISAILHPVISYYLPHGWREAFQYVSISMKLDATTGNARAGVKFEF